MAVTDLQSIAFPILDESQIVDLSRCAAATPKVYPDGATLFAVGDRNFKFHVIKSGEVEIFDYSGDEPKTLTVHHQGGFTGDISHLTGNPLVVSAVARGDCEVYEISADALMQVLNRPAATLAQVGGLYRSAGYRLPLFGRHLPGPGFPGEEPCALHLGGRGDGSSGGSAPEAVWRD